MGAGNLREYKWEEINEALMLTKHSAPGIWKVSSVLNKVVGRDDARMREEKGISGNMKKYSWNELNKALILTHHSPAWICRILFALQRVKNRERTKKHI
jgi:hypothetical protein